MSSFDMFVLRRDLRWMFPLLFLGGVLSNMCKVKFEQQHICAVRGSSVVILCSFYNSDRKTLNRFSWGHVKPNQTKARLISGSKFRKVVEQFEFVGDGDQNCSLKIQQVEPKYAGKYFLRVANSKTRCINRSLMLIVVDLKILLFSSNEDGTIKEGDSVTLSCTNSCDGDNPSSVFTWFKNGEPINEGKVLDFRNISFANSGNYSCSLKTQRGTTSGIRRVDVGYGPKNTSVLVRSSAGAEDGDNITLICSSDAYPPVLNYSWFKIAEGGRILKVGHQLAFVPGDGAQYLCSVTNKHGSQNSTVFTLEMKSYWTTFSKNVCLIVIIAALLVGTMIIAACRLTRKRLCAPKAGCEEATQSEDYVNWLMSDSQEPQDERLRGEGDAAEIVYAAVVFCDKRQPVMKQQNSGNEVVIYSSVCRDQTLNRSFIEPS